MSDEASTSIGRLNESSLHAAVKQWCARPGDQLEVDVDGYVVDVVRDDLLIEVQTSSFASIRDKLDALCRDHRVRLVYPLIQERRIIKYDADCKQILSNRRSPKKGHWADLFDELVYMPGLIDRPNLELQVVLVKVDEIRCDDGQGTWRRKGVSVLDRRLEEVVTHREFCCGQDLAVLLPDELASSFTNRQLARALSVRISTAQKTSYCLRKLGVIEQIGRKGRALLFARANAAPSD